MSSPPIFRRPPWPTTRHASRASSTMPTGLSCLASALGGEPWREFPPTYILCQHDRAVHPEMRRWMSTRAGRVIVYETDHSPFLSTPERFVDDLDQIAAAV